MKGHPATDWGHLPQIFKDRRRRSGHPEDRGALPAVQPYLRASRFQGCRCLRATARPAFNGGTDDRRTVKEGREPSPGPPSMSLGSFTSPWCGLGRNRVSHAPPSRSRNLDLVPFRWRARRPSANSPLAKRAPRGGPPSPADCRKQTRVATSSPPRPAESGGNPRDIGTMQEQALTPPRRAIVHPRHGITRPLRTD